MAVDIGALSVVLSADTTRFNRGMSNATNTIQNFSSVSKSASALSIAVWTKAIDVITRAGAALVRGFVNNIKGAFVSIDDLAKTSDRLNLTTEALASMRLHGELLGASNRDVDKSLEQLAKRSVEAAIGLEEPLRAFRLLKLSAVELSQIGTAEQFRAVAGAWNNVADSDRVFTAMALFGRSGVKMINILNAGVEALDASADQAERLGLTISRVDAAKVEAANDAILEMKKSFEGIAIEFAPKIAFIVEGIAKSITSVDSGLINIDFVMQGVVFSSATIAESWKTIREAFLEVKLGVAQQKLNRKLEAIGIFGLTPERDQAFDRLQQEVQRLKAALLLSQISEPGKGIATFLTNSRTEFERAAERRRAAAAGNGDAPPAGLRHEEEKQTDLLQKLFDSMEKLRKDFNQQPATASAITRSLSNDRLRSGYGTSPRRRRR